MAETTYLYIFAVLPSSSGSAISGAVVGYVTGICTNKKLVFEFIVGILTFISRINYRL